MLTHSSAPGIEYWLSFLCHLDLVGICICSIAFCLQVFDLAPLLPGPSGIPAHTQLTVNPEQSMSPVLEFLFSWLFDLHVSHFALPWWLDGFSLVHRLTPLCSLGSDFPSLLGFAGSW